MDFSCALKLAISVAVLAAMCEDWIHGIFVKGNMYLDTTTQSDTVIFGKNGTLTYAWMMTRCCNWQPAKRNPIPIP